MNRLQLLAAVVLLPVIGHGVLAADAPSPSQPTTAPAAPKVIDATDADAIQDALPKTVIVTGTVSDIDTQGSSTALHFTGTEKSEFYAVVLARSKDTVEAAFGEGLKNLAGKTIHITGKVVEYQGKPEIVISKPEQISIVEK